MHYINLKLVIFRSTEVHLSVEMLLPPVKYVFFTDPVTEESLAKKGFVSPEDVLRLPRITES